MQKRINMSLSIDLIERIDKMADDMGMNRSSVITMAFNQFEMNQQALKEIQNIPKLMAQLEELRQKVDNQQLSLPMD